MPRPKGSQWANFATFFSSLLDGTNPLTLLADSVPGARMVMGEQTLVVVGAEFTGGSAGFIILTDHVDLANGDHASGEELQDHGCAIGRSPG